MKSLIELWKNKLWRCEKALFGGWRGVTRSGHAVWVVRRCQAPDWALYRQNWNERKKEGR